VLSRVLHAATDRDNDVVNGARANVQAPTFHSPGQGTACALGGSMPLHRCLLLLTLLASCTPPDAGPPDASSARDCSEYGGGQSVLAQRCNGDLIEYCIYSDTTQRASWSEIERCVPPLHCTLEDDVASCR
jgi:hypothetical protein